MNLNQLPHRYCPSLLIAPGMFSRLDAHNDLF
jgi:hypothetical protein